MSHVAALVTGLLIVANAQAKDARDNSQSVAAPADDIGKYTNQYTGSDALKPSLGIHSKFLMPLRPSSMQQHTTPSSAVVEDAEPSQVVDRETDNLFKPGRSSPVELSFIFASLLVLSAMFGIRMRRSWLQRLALAPTRDDNVIALELHSGAALGSAAILNDGAHKPQGGCRRGGWWWPSSLSSCALTISYATPPGRKSEADVPPDRIIGTVIEVNSLRSFGFIEPDDGRRKRMYVSPSGCGAFGKQLPPRGTRVTYEVKLDSKSGRQRANDVQPEASPGHAFLAEQTGVMLNDMNEYGFIKADDNGDHMFVMPSGCQGFGDAFPPQGTAVTYDVVLDEKTGRPRADNVRPYISEIDDLSFVRSLWSSSAEVPLDRHTGTNKNNTIQYHSRHTGTVIQADSVKSYGFIEPDDGGKNVYFSPSGCGAFGKQLPPKGTRVTYEVKLDSKSGRQRANDLRPEAPPGHALLTAQTGVMLTDMNEYGFIKADEGGDKMFVMPRCCQGFGNLFPPLGTAVAYDVVLDDKTGRPRANNVRPAYISRMKRSLTDESWLQSVSS